jgi:simple sugar transport system ATP-binding protein
MENNQKNKLSLKNISVSFPGVKALSNVDFEIESGKIYALIGANGAGKSTLMKVISGVNSNYEGEIFYNGELIEIRSPREAFEYGIQTVYQEVDTALVPSLTVGENIYMNKLVNQMGKKQMINRSEVYSVSQRQLKDLKINIDVHKKVEDLTLAEKQMILIAKAVIEDCKFLLLDEPTAPLSNSETERLFEIVRKLVKEKNVGIVFISHRLQELFEICEEITIMREGKIVHEQKIDQDLTIRKIVDYMLGDKKVVSFQRENPKIGETILSVKNLNEEEDRVSNISFELREGEILGIAGLVGGGKTELCKALFGVYDTSWEEFLLDGKNLNIKNPTHAVKNGLALVPEERRKEGILIKDPVYGNITLSVLDKFLNKFKFVSKDKQIKSTKNVIEALEIKTPSVSQRVELLSGGNQQKVVIGKRLESQAKVYIFDEPTKGVDIGAKIDIYKLIDDLANHGKGIIYASCEFSEILSLTDRVLVMYDGKIVKELVTKDTNEKELLYYSTGGQ